MVFTKLFLENALAIRPCNYGAASEPLLLKVARCIPVLSSRHMGKCTARVLKRSGATDQDRILTSKNPEQAPNLEFFSGTDPDFQIITQAQDTFLTINSQTSKMPVASLKNDRSNSNFPFKKFVYLLANHTVRLSQSLSINCIATNLCCL